MKVKKDNIVLYPAKGTVRIGSILRVGESDRFVRVVDIDAKGYIVNSLFGKRTKNVHIIKDNLTYILHKYYVIKKGHLIGELAFSNYEDYINIVNNLKELNKEDYTFDIELKEVYTKGKIGDVVVINCPSLSNFIKWNGRKRIGTIITVNRGIATIELDDGDTIDKHRHTYSLYDIKDKRTICSFV